jgi:hypothetical protein
MSSSRSSRSRAAIALTLLASVTSLTLDPSRALAQSASSTPETSAASPPLTSTPHARNGLVLGGALLFVLPYIASAIAATTSYTTDSGTEASRGVLWVPAVGPFILLGKASSAAAGVVLVADGLAQVGGLTMFSIGLAMPKSGVGVETRTGARLSVSPLLLNGASGASLTATF